VINYPEWDWRARSYREPCAAVHLLDAPHGARDWVARTLEEHRVMLQVVRRQFESLRAERMRLRQQNDGEEPDLEACIDAFADARAGAALRAGLYQTTRRARREMAVLLLIDVSGSTDGWASSHRRVIDVEREALLLVCLALENLGEPYSVLAFSGEGPARVTIREVKRFAECYGDDIALRIAGLEPERYTRAGAAIRHASALLMREQVRHRLLLVLSDGKPNDMDEYDGRYGVEDMRQSVIEARLQGVFPFCLTIDRQTASYLPAVFGEHQYAVLHRPELLPTALLGWLRRLVHA
jgi:nitric oxide reductase NorD protein